MGVHEDSEPARNAAMASAAGFKTCSYFMDLYLMNTGGTQVRRLAHAPGGGGPFFSADGEKIVWRRFSEDGVQAEISTMNIDGSEKQQITDLGALSWAPYFHPSGDYIIFSSNYQHGPRNFELYLVDAKGQREPVQVTHNPGFDGLPVVTPDAYRGLDVKGKWVMVLRELPHEISAEQRQHLAPYSDLRYKAMLLARDKGYATRTENGP